jgi:hypothetical protein
MEIPAKQTPASQPTERGPQRRAAEFCTARHRCYAIPWYVHWSQKASGAEAAYFQAPLMYIAVWNGERVVDEVKILAGQAAGEGVNVVWDEM